MGRGARQTQEQAPHDAEEGDAEPMLVVDARGRQTMNQATAERALANASQKRRVRLALTGTKFNEKVLKIISDLASESLPPTFYAFTLRGQMDKLYVKAAHPDLKAKFAEKLPNYPRAFQDFDAAWKATHALILHGRNGAPALIALLERGIKKAAGLILKALADLVGEEQIRQTADAMDAMAKEASKLGTDVGQDDPPTAGPPPYHGDDYFPEMGGKRKYPEPPHYAPRGRGRGQAPWMRGRGGPRGRGGRGGPFRPGGRGFLPVRDDDRDNY